MDSAQSFLFAHCQEKYPHKLAAGFPHVIQNIAKKWSDADAMADYFTDLLIPSRPNRRGFEPDVAAEIMALSMAYDRIGPIRPGEQVHSQSQFGTVLWDDVRNKDKPDALAEEFTVSHFARAVESGDVGRGTHFITAGLDVNGRDSRYWTPLMVAAFNGKEDLALKLLQNGADVLAEDNRGYTPMHWAAFNGFYKVIEVLRKRGGVVNVKSHAGITPLLQAAARGHVETVVELINDGADPNIAANDGSTALLKAVANGHLSIINFLLAVGASVNVTMKNGTSLKDVALHAPDPAVRERLLALFKCV